MSKFPGKLFGNTAIIPVVAACVAPIHSIPAVVPVVLAETAIKYNCPALRVSPKALPTDPHVLTTVVIDN